MTKTEAKAGNTTNHNHTIKDCSADESNKS